MHEIRCSLKPEVALTAYELLLLLEQVLNVCIMYVMYVCVYVGVCAHTHRDMTDHSPCPLNCAALSSAWEINTGCRNGAIWQALERQARKRLSVIGLWLVSPTPLSPQHYLSAALLYSR